MDKKTKKIIFSFFIIGLVIITFSLLINKSSDIALFNQAENSTAQVGDYVPITSGLELKSSETDSGGVMALLNDIFGWGIAVAIVLATLFVIMGAIQYMTTDAYTGKQSGKERMTAAIGGLVLALMSWLILYTINENIFTSNFLLTLRNVEIPQENQPTNVEGSAPTGGTSNEDAKNAISEKGVQAGSSVNLEGASSESLDVISDIGSNFDSVDDDGDKIPVVLSSANTQNNYYEFNSSDQNLNIDDYFSEKVTTEGDIITNTPYVSNISGQPVEITKTSTGWGVKVLSDNSGSSLESTVDGGDSPPQGGTSPESDEGAGDNQEVSYGTSSFNQETYFEQSNPTNNTSPIIIPTTQFTTPPITQTNLYDGGAFDGFQEQAVENIFIRNLDADAKEMSDDMQTVLKTIRNSCCGLVEFAGGGTVYSSSLNISDLSTSENFIFMEKSVINQYQLRGNLWKPIMNLMIDNLYANQNLVDITEYLECRSKSGRSSRGGTIYYSGSCTIPENFRELDEKYTSLDKKGVDIDDLYEGESYIGELGGVRFVATYGESSESWYLQL